MNYPALLGHSLSFTVCFEKCLDHGIANRAERVLSLKTQFWVRHWAPKVREKSRKSLVHPFVKP